LDNDGQAPNNLTITLEVTMETILRKMTISVLMITFGLLCAISPPVFASDKYPNYEAPEAVIAQAKNRR
jgi:hypothetical protein